MTTQPVQAICVHGLEKSHKKLRALRGLRQARIGSQSGPRNPQPGDAGVSRRETDDAAPVRPRPVRDRRRHVALMCLRSAALEERDDGQDASVVVVVPGQVWLHEDGADVFLHGVLGEA